MQLLEVVQVIIRSEVSPPVKLNLVLHCLSYMYAHASVCVCSSAHGWVVSWFNRQCKFLIM